MYITYDDYISMGGTLLDEECAKKYIELLVNDLKETEYIKLNFISDKYLSKHGEIYTNFTSEELEYTYYAIKKWLSENEA